MDQHSRTPSPNERGKNTHNSEQSTDYPTGTSTSNFNVEHLRSELTDVAQQMEGEGGTITKPVGPDYRAMGEALRVRIDEDIPAPPVCLAVVQGDQRSTFGTLGNFSVLIGKAKSRKTFTISIAVAAAMRSDVVLDCFAGSFPPDKRTVLYFDTEQGRYHVQKVVKRICRLAGEDAPVNLLVYHLRPLSAVEVLGFIQWHIYNTPGVGLVIIDGIRDTVNDINDNTEATQRSRDLLRWSEELQIHILTVLHMNKGNDHARGTLGTELQNKAETVVSIALDPHNKEVSVVTAEMCRDRAFESFAFTVDMSGTPCLVGGYVPPMEPATRAKARTQERGRETYDRIQALREKGYKGAELATLAGISKGQISKIENAYAPASDEQTDIGF